MKLRVLTIATASVLAWPLSACNTVPREPPIRTVEVRVPVSTPCAAKPGPAPNYPDSDAALRGAPNLAEALKLLLAGRLLRIGREAELEAAVKGCS
jgi:hypothetical protein